jgi:hypothetical protein
LTVLKHAAVNEAKAVADEDESAAKAECATGRRAKCLGLEARADQSRQRLEAARTALAQAGVVPSDPQARRLAITILLVSEEAVQLYQPLVLPLAISALGLLLLGDPQASEVGHADSVATGESINSREAHGEQERRNPMPDSDLVAILEEHQARHKARRAIIREAIDYCATKPELHVRMKELFPTVDLEL